MDWRLKAGAQKLLSWLPGSRKLYYALQRRLTGSLQINDFFLTDRLQHVERHLEAWRSHRSTPVPHNSLELGTGWYPVVPLGLFLSGVNELYTLDLHPLLTLDSIHKLNHWLLEWHQSGRLQTLLPALQAERWQQLQKVLKAKPPSLHTALEALSIHYLTLDARKIPLSDASVQLIHSNNTFEHIPKASLQEILTEMKRIAHPGGLMSHYVDMADHYSYTDPDISPNHFLRYTEKQWRWIENPFQSQNRLRLPHYREMYERLEIPLQETVNEKGMLPQGDKLAPLFAALPREELAVLYTQLITSWENKA
jgi:hypothetical protein